MPATETKTVNWDALVAALAKRERDYRDALDTLRDEIREGDDEKAYLAARSLREAIDLVGCLRRLVKDRTVLEIHTAFGAPGDFGYETPIGAALARVYGVAP